MSTPDNRCDDVVCLRDRSHWRGEVTTSDDGGTVWYTNAIRFHSRDASLDYVHGLAVRWTLVTRWRAVDSSVPERQFYEPGSEDGKW